MTRSIKDEAELIADNIECATQRRWVSEDERSTAVLNIKAGLERQLAAKDAEVKRLREAIESLCEAASTTRAYMSDQNQDAKWADEAIQLARQVISETALAATSRGEGQS